jgi:hypothetical protein
MNTYFVRHNIGIDIDDQTRSRLWRERRIAMHYPHDKNEKLHQRDNSSLDTDDYVGKGKQCVKTLLELAEQGGYVCAQHHPQPEWMLGVVRPNSRIELVRGTWGDRSGLEGRTAIVKTLRLSNVKFVDPLDYARLSVGRPRQGTIVQWHLVGKTVEHLVRGRRSKPELSDLLPRQQEIFCSEFLRLPQAASQGLPRLAQLLLPTGHTMRDIDIIGIATDGKMLLAQVTFLPLESATGKIERLLPHRDAKRRHLLFFCDCEGRTDQDGISIFPIRHAYNTFTSTVDGRLWLRRSA